MSNVILYTTGCPRCAVLKEKLDAAGITYTTISDTDAIIKNGITFVPILECNGVRMDFMTANKWILDGGDS